MARTINTSVTGPVVIGSGDSPLNITSTGSVTSTGSGEDGIDQVLSGAVTVDNAGEIASSDGTGVSLRVGFIANTGSISGIDGVFFAGGDPADVKNAAGGTISGFGADGFGVHVAGFFGLVVNDGRIAGGASGVALDRSGRVSNTGSILGSKDGVFIQGVNVGDPVTNSGTISATATDGVGVDVDRGNITNNADGSISGGAFGVLIERGSGTVANAGSIAGDYGVALEAGGSVSNPAGASISGQTAGAFFIGGAGTLTNSGTISATATSGAGVDLEGGGSVTNNAGGSISGGAYGVFIEGGIVNTITNAGTVSGGTYAVFFSGDTTNRLVVDPGAVFDGAVNGGGGTLELAFGTDSIGGVDTGSFDNFQTVAVDQGAIWTLNGSNTAPSVLDHGTLAIDGSLVVSRAIDPSSTGLFQLDDGATLEVAAAAGTLTRINFLGSSELLIDDAASFGINVGTPSYAGTQLQNFVAGDTIDLKNFSSTGVTLNFDPATGVLQVSNDASQVASLDFQTSSLGSDAFQATGDGATGIFITIAPSTTGTAALPSTGDAGAGFLALFNQFVAAGFHDEQSGIGQIASMPQIHALTKAGVENIILLTLPDLGITPLAHSNGPDVVAFAHELSVLNNEGIQQIAASHPNVQLVDTFQLSEAIAADPHGFGFTADISTPWLQLVAAGSTTFAPNEVGFFDGDHPTYAGHGVIAAFADAVLTSTDVQFLDGTQSVVHAGHGDNFIFATPPDPANPHPVADYTIYGGSGNDIIFAGSGNVTVYGGSGTELIAAGSGNATLEAGNGTDVLATNSTGTNLLEGGRGNDALIANRGGTNVMIGGSGTELFVLKEGNGLVNGNDSFNFGSQIVEGDHKGNNTLRLIINDQTPSSENTLIAEFEKIEKAFDASMLTNHPGSFQVDGLTVTNLDSLQLQVDSVSKDPSTPYLITHTLLDTDGHGAPVSAPLQAQLVMAEHWGLLTV